MEIDILFFIYEFYNFIIPLITEEERESMLSRGNKKEIFKCKI